MHTDTPIDDPYALLGIAANASGEQIRRAYRRAAMDWHPDRNTSDAAEETFKRIRLAYELLRDPDRRAEYDRARRRRPARTRKASQGRAAAGEAPAKDAEPGPARGSDLKRVLHIPLERQPEGFRARLPIERRAECGACRGTGQGSPEAHSCPACLGSGRVRRPVLGFLFLSAEPCRACAGRGWTVPPCPGCGGTGRVRKAGNLSFDVPPGVRSGAILRIRGHGREGRAGKHPGDLLVRVEFERHPFFRHEFPDLVCEVPVGLLQALAGTTLEVPTLEGITTLTLPPGSGESTQVRLPGRGLLDGGTGRRGNLIVKPSIVPPEGLTPDMTDLLEQIRRDLAASPAPPRILRDWARRIEQVKRRIQPSRNPGG